ncbi:hypothetical protein ABNN70_10535 [Sporolactobacillus sp. Y61]|uniref:Uncharacterized protein n=1 Tax=Sporolactobacillus sp. Y61 TaxID=3160863 RepID=A0AAU8ID33_9BACL
MSFVSIIASDQWASVVSDNHLVDMNKQGKIVVRPGSKPSALRISDSQIICCTGSASALREIRENFLFRDEAYKISQDQWDWLTTRIRRIPHQVQDVLLAVVDHSQKMTCQMISNQPGDTWHRLYPEGERLAALYMAGRGVDEYQIRQISAECSRLIRKSGKNSVEQVSSAQKALNKFAGDLDHTIGTRTFLLHV